MTGTYTAGSPGLREERTATKTEADRPPAPRTLWVIGTGAGPVSLLPTLLTGLAQDGFDCRVVLSPAATELVDLKALELLTGRAVLHRFEAAGGDRLPELDAVLAAPLTFTSLNKWAAGHADTLAIQLLCAALGKRRPVVAVPWFDADLAAHPVVGANMRTLASGVRFTRSLAELRHPGAEQDPGIPERWWQVRRLLAKTAPGGPDAGSPDAWSAVLLSQITPAAREVLRYLAQHPPGCAFEDVLQHLAASGHPTSSLQLGGVMTTVRAAHKRVAPNAPRRIGRDQARRRYLIDPETAAALAAIFADEAQTVDEGR